MKFAALIVLSLSALALAGPAYNKQQQQQQQDYVQEQGIMKSSSEAILKKWCSSADMSQEQLTGSFKELVQAIKSQPEDQQVEQLVMNERICQGQVESSNKVQDTKIHDYIKDLYMDALIACDSQQCMKQLNKIIGSHEVDSVRASYYMTRLAVSDKDSINDEEQVIGQAQSFIQSPKKSSPAVERQQMFAATSLIGKHLEATNKQHTKQTGAATEEVKKVAKQLATTIVARYIKPVTMQEVKQYQEQQQVSSQVAMKIAKRNAALKALTNLPGWLIAEIQEVQQVCLEIAQNKDEMLTSRQSAIECLEEAANCQQQLKQIAFDQEEPIEVRVAAYRALMTTFSGPKEQQQQQAEQIVKQIVDHCEQPQKQQEDDQFVLYVVSHLENLSRSQQPELEQLKESIKSNKQINMKIQLLSKKFKRALADIRKSSRNYKLEQEFNQLESGLIVEGDLIYESKQWTEKQQQQTQILPKLVRVNMSMPVMGETVNVIEVTVRQNQMDEHFLGALKLAESSKLTGESVARIVDSFKSSVSSSNSNNKHQNQQQQQPEADLSIKVDGCTVVYVCLDDFKTNEFTTRQRRSVGSYSIIDEIIEHLKRNPIAFNRGFNFNVNERFAKLLDVDAQLIAGLRFESRATGQSSEDFELVVKAEPRFALEAVVGPAKLNKKLLQRLSTKTALGMRLRFKRDQLVDLQVELPENTMELFTVETKLVEQTPAGRYVELKGNQQLIPSWISSKKNSNSVYAKLMSSNKRSIEHTWQMSEKSARALGVRGQLRLEAKPSGFMMQAVCQKYEQSMQGYRVQIKRVASSGAANQEQYLWVLSTPGSQIDRTLQVRVTKQSQSGRILVKTEMKSPKESIVAVWELIRDGRQYGLKAELASVRANKQWRHSFSAGLQSSQSARGFSTFKPFVSIKSSELKRPIEMQGTISVQAEPKLLITYNMRSPSGDNFVQGKLSLEQRQSPVANTQGYRRRSMRSPVELVLQRDLTLTKEIVGQFDRATFKLHSMVDWDASKSAIQCDGSIVTKNLAKSQENQYQVQLKLDTEQQRINIERKCLDQPRKDHRFTLQAGFVKPTGHHIQLECQYHGKRQPQAVVLFKHFVDVQQIANNKLELTGQVELISSEHQINEKLTGRTQITNERKLKQIHTELIGRNKQCKLNVDFVSLAEHQIELFFKGQQWQHQSNVRADRRQFELQSRTHCYNKKQAEVQVIYQKETGECQIVYDCPVQQIRLVADLKPLSGKQSSVAVQTPSVQSKAEFYFESMPGKRLWSGLNKPQIGQFRLKSDLKNMISQDVYWMDSHYQPTGKSFLRMNSPIYRSDIEYDPSVEETKFGLFARSKRSIDGQLYANDDDDDYMQSPFEQLTNNWSQKLGSNKMWMVRSLIASPNSMEQLKQKARRALFEFADKRQSQKHQFQYEPLKGISFDLERKPFGPEQQQQLQSMRLKGDLNLFNDNQQDMRPSTISMDSDMFDFDFESKPFEQEEESSYAKLSAVSRFPRSAFKHDAELRYQKNKGYKAHMKHEDAEGKRHQWQLETDDEPKRYAKMSFDSEKHGKVDAEYNWRKHLTKRAHDNEEVYANRVAFKAQGPRDQYSHDTTLSWEEPRKMISLIGRQRRDIFAQSRDMDSRARYNVLDYLKHIDARLQSRTEKNQNELYNVDFDYKPESHARLSVQMPEDMLHESSFQFQPTERLYKLQSKLYNRRTQQPTYEILANTKPISGLATGQQEPVFVDYEHSILERPIVGAGLSSLFKQPMRVDYTDKFGRVANFDYDFAPIVGQQQPIYAGLRQKRAAVYYKDQDFEHSSNYDFYPETLFGAIKPTKRVPGDVAMKVHTKYGPIVLHADSNGQQVEMKVESPVIDAELSCEAKRQGKLFKINLDNKQQRVKLTKIVRQTPILEDIELVKDLAKKIDEGRIEHESELLVSFVSSILKLKSETKMNERQVMVIDAELNKQTEKAYIKINGERINGQAVVDLVNKTADLVLDVDDKRTLSHRTRLVRVNEHYYAMDSMTTYKSKPVIKVNAKICAKIFDTTHLLSSTRRHSAGIMSAEHLSTFEAIVYGTKYEQPKQITGQYDCIEKEARIIYKDLTGGRRTSDVRIKFDDQNEDLHVAVRTIGQNGTTKQFQKTINVSPLVEAY